MIPYLSVFGLFALLGLRDFQNQTRVIVIGLSIFLIWFAGLRFFVGCDFESYVIRYQESQNLSWSAILGKAEWGFGIMTAIFAKAGLPYAAFQAFATSLIIILYAKFALKHDQPIYLLALFFPILILQLGMSGMRQAIALGFILLAYSAFIDQKRVMIGVWIVAAFLFHNSAIILLPIAFLAGRDISLPRLIAGFIILTPIAALFLGERIEVYSDRYVEQIYGSQESAGAWYRYLFTVIPVAAFLGLRTRIKQQFPEVYPLLLLGALFTIAISATAYISSVALHRLTFFAMPLSILMTLYVARVMTRDTVRIQLAWLGFFGAYMAVWFVTSRHATVCFQPYQNFTFSELIRPAWATVF